MFWRDNERKNQSDNKTEDKSHVTQQTMSREEFFGDNEEAKKVYQDIMELKKSIEDFKASDKSEVPESETAPKGQEQAKSDAADDTGRIYLEETEEIIAAKQTIIDRARKDAEKERQEREEARKKELAKQEEHQKVLEAQRQAALAAEEAEKKRLEAIEAEKRAKEISRRKVFEDMEAAMMAKNIEMNHTATEEEMDEFFGKDSGSVDSTAEDSLEMAKKELLEAQKKQGEVLNKISTITEKTTEKLAEVQQQKLTQQQILLKQEQERLQELLEYQRTVRQEKAQKAATEKQIKEQKAKIEKIIKDEKLRRKKAEKAQRHEDKERVRREKREAQEKLRLEKARKIAEAELGGGVVNVHDVQINTELKRVAKFSWRELLGMASKKEKKASSEDERQVLKDEREKRTEEARAIADMMAKQRIKEYEKSVVGRKSRAIKQFCDRHKVALLTLFAIALALGVGTAGVFNYCTAYEYSYNGKSLGLVKSKEDVLQITDLVQDALTEEVDVTVVMDQRKDIDFKRVPVLKNEKIDSSEEVLKRLTYMGDLNVKAYGIYVDGEKIGAVKKKEIAADVLQDIKDRYSSGRKGAEIEEAVFIEKVEVKQSNTDLADISTEEEMVEKLCTSGNRESKHKVVAGETLADIAKLYSMTEKEILDDNENVDPRKLDVGSFLVIKQNAPVITVKITELITYEQKIKYETEKRKDKTIYEGDTELKQKGKNGLNEVTSRFVSVNGETIEEINLVTTVKKEPVKKVVLVGTKERPPTVGSGKYIWPLNSGTYTVTSEFGARWGRLHAGIDMGCPVGTDVHAADGGTVTQAGYNGSYGYLVVIDHQNGQETYYAHNSELLVSVGDKVYQGQHIAESGNTGRSTGPHSHFEIHINGSAQNPRNYLP